jgi:Plasmid pRiA4b ORF-3-like protein
MKNTHSSPFKRLILRAVLNEVSPIVARVFSITDDIEITDLHDVFLSMLGWQHDLGFIIRVHGQEFNSYQRRSRGKRLGDFQLRRQEKFLYICNTLDLWEWELRVLDIQDGNVDERGPECLEGAHLLLQTRTKVLDGDLEGVFRQWYPQFRPVFAASPNP